MEACVHPDFSGGSKSKSKNTDNNAYNTRNKAKLLSWLQFFFFKETSSYIADPTRAKATMKAIMNFMVIDEGFKNVLSCPMSNSGFSNA